MLKPVICSTSVKPRRGYTNVFFFAQPTQIFKNIASLKNDAAKVAHVVTPAPFSLFLFLPVGSLMREGSFKCAGDNNDNNNNTFRNIAPPPIF